MDRMSFGRKTVNGQRPRVDRFVPPRDSIPELQRRFVWSASQPSTADIWHTKYLKQKKYINFLDDALGLEPLCAQESRDELLKIWPCKPRKKCYLSSVDGILYLPNYSTAPFPDLVDWSKDNILVAALGKNYHKWSWHSQSVVCTGETQSDIHSCKYDPRGELLLLGTAMKTLEIHDNALSQCVKKSGCQCLERDGELCFITAVDWSPTGNSFVTGCNRGTLASFSRKARLIKWRDVLKAAVLAARISPNARYVAAAPTHGDTITVMSWPTLQIYSEVESNTIFRSLTWHPWRSAMLAIGSVTADGRACLATWDVASGKLQQSMLGNTPYQLDYMLFSKITGELVLSLWNCDQALISPKSGFQMVVLSDCDTMVDQWGEGQAGVDRVRTMVFSPDGSKLVTATRDEDLIIWNFLPEDMIKKKANSRKFSSMPVLLDQASFGFSLR